MTSACTPVEATIFVAIISVLLSILSLKIGVLLVIGFKKDNSDNKGTEKYYFSATLQSTVICNILCCIAVSIYSVWIIFASTFQFEEIITLRALPTIFWFIGKVSLIWLWNGRLYYAFKGSRFPNSYIYFISINTLIAVSAPVCLSLGYLGVWKANPIMISAGFEGFRFLYIFLTFILLFMLSKKMILLHRMQNVSPLEDIVTTTTAETAESPTKKSESGSETAGCPGPATFKLSKRSELQFFMNITVKNIILVLLISVSACLVAFWWSAFDYILVQNCLTLSVPMNVFSVDCVTTSCCVYLLFACGASTYDKYFGECYKCCGALLTSMCI